ncbi:hypothetical protein E2C01_049334 [Portunus trituberculatus]|uniref:Uncharacterized protein n=1 Tax=Portunus trituberculatus TaxID=210409 RepID=A0A5B7GCS7_PORTR|nr:hypothetical protein [Portunus trituberculatus]
MERLMGALIHLMGAASSEGASTYSVMVEADGWVSWEGSEGEVAERRRRGGEGKGERERGESKRGIGS